MEFVIVTFPTERRVNVDGAPRGRTGLLLRVQAGTHSFDLGVPADYAPPVVVTPVRGTSATAPLTVPFTPLATRRPISRKRKKAVRRRRVERNRTPASAVSRKPARTRSSTRGTRKTR